MKSVNYSLETALVDALKAVVQDEISVYGLIQAAQAGEMREQDLTSVQVRVFNMSQPYESMHMYSTTAEIRLMVEQAESANGGLYTDMHEAIALYLQSVMLGDACVALSTDDVDVDGLQVNGGDADFDASSGEWFAVWNLTLTGRLKKQNENTEVV